MAKKFLVSLDLSKNELLNARIQNLASAPSSPVTGQTYYDTALGKFGVFNGTTWDYMGTSEATGDVSSNTASSVDGEVALFSGTGGKTIKRATGTGLAKLTSGVLSTATAGTDYLAPNGDGSALTGITSDQVSNESATSGTTVTDAINDIDSRVSNSEGDITTLQSDVTTLQSTKADITYVDNAVQGLSWKDAVVAATTGNVTLAGSAPNTVDGVTLAANDRILVRAQSTGSQNGIYIVQTLGTGANGTWVRANDADSSADIDAATVYVEGGSTYADTVWTLTTDNPTLGTTALTFAQINGGAVPQASTTTQGKVELATQAETQAKTDTDRAVTPSGLADFARKYTGTIGDNSATSIAVTHGLGSQWVTAQVFDASSNAQVECDVVLTSSTQTTFTFATAPTTNQYRVVITG